MTERLTGPAWNDIKEQLREESNTCVYCGVTGVGSIDHKVPLALGGSNDLDNLVISCSPCNRLKGDMPYSLWLELLPYLKLLLIEENRIRKGLYINKQLYKSNKERLKEINRSYLDKGLYPSKEDEELKRVRAIDRNLQSVLSNLEHLNERSSNALLWVRDLALNEIKGNEK